MKAADLNTKLALLSTRNNGLPTTYYPVLTDFNYVVAQLSINEKEYLIDATEKFNPFGILPFRALNINARIMDFKKGSYWTAIEPYKKNVNYLIANLTLDENELISGNVTEIYTGYKAIEKRKEIDKKTKTEYKEFVSELINKHNQNILIQSNPYLMNWKFTIMN